MRTRLAEARSLAENVRFSLDVRSSRDTIAPDRISQARGFFAQRDLEISEALTPSLHGQLIAAYATLGLPSQAVHSFVFASPELQAECLASSRDECLIRISSGLIDLLGERELSFIAGHEVGHFLLGHQISAQDGSLSQLEHYMRLRYQEISADRIGLLACASLDDAVRALMKSSSGLSDRHLRFDVSAFLSQLRHVEEGASLDQVKASHPALLIRARALLWFSMSDAYQEREEGGQAYELGKVDEWVAEDLRRYVDASAQRVLQEARESLTLWMVADFVIRQGVFRKVHQEAAEELLAVEVVDGLRRFLGGLDPSSARIEVDRRLEEAGDQLRSLIPSAFEKERAGIRQAIREVMDRQEAKR